VRVVAFVLLVLVLVICSAMLWQHSRYVGIRQDLLHDRQATFYSSDVFHTLVFLRTAPEKDVIEEVRAFKQATEGSEASWIYAGKSALAPLSSSQMGENDWTAVVLLQYPSRDAYAQHAESKSMREALARFEETYTQGFRRGAFSNAMIPQGLLASRLFQLVTLRPSYFPFAKAKDYDRFPEAEEYARQLLEEKDLGRDALLIVNLTKAGTPEEQAADRAYGASMLGAMAEAGYGPIHAGRPVRLERDYDFDMVLLVFYPGVEFFAEMMKSEFYQSIFGDKQVGDTQANMTVPILDRL
jgi:hypothetical protein